MRTLEPNPEGKLQYISKNCTFVSITDFKAIHWLREIIVGPGQHSWHWIPLKADATLDISDIGNKVCSFEYAINRYVNDPYRTVYAFDDFGEFIKEWGNIKYINPIITNYKIQEDDDWE